MFVPCNQCLLLTEPGFYQEGEFGVKIENVAVVKPEITPVLQDIILNLMATNLDTFQLLIMQYNHDGVQYLTMETISLVPIQLKMVVPEMLNEDEVSVLDTTFITSSNHPCVLMQISWINNYHTQCLEIVGATLLEEGLQVAHQWLMRETQLLG